MLRFSTGSVCLIILSIFSLIIVTRPLGVSGQLVPIVGVWSNTYSAANATDASLIVGSSVTFEVNVTGAPNFNGYEFTLFYDSNFLKAQSVDFTTGTVFNAPFVARNDLGSVGEVAVSVVNLGSAFSGGFGTLLHIRFLVTGVGSSPVTLASGIASPSTGAQSWTRLVMGLQPIDVSTTDGYFKNDLSKIGPVASFSFTPVSALLGETVTFDASSSFDPDNDTIPSRGIISYGWDFGDGFSITTTFPVIAHRFGMFQPPPGYSGKFSVRLTATDGNDGLEGMQAQTVSVSTVAPPLADFQVATTPDSIAFTPGGRLVASAFFISLGGFQGNVSVSTRIVPAFPTSPAVSFSPSSVIVPKGFSAVSTVSVNTTVTTTPGSYDVIVTGSNGQLSRSHLIEVTVLKSNILPSISVKNGFTSGGLTPLKLDSSGNPRVDVVLAKNIVRSTNPGEIFSWTNITNSGPIPFSSLLVSQQLPNDWILNPQIPHSAGRVRVFFQPVNGSLKELVSGFSIATSGFNPQTIDLRIPDLNASAGKLLDHDDTILLSAKLDYALAGSFQSPENFPVTYRSMTHAIAWTSPSFAGSNISADGIATFKAFLKLMGDVNGDGVVDIVDLALVGYSFGSKPGSPNWNPTADLDGSHRIDVQDLAIVAFTLGDHL